MKLKEARKFLAEEIQYSEELTELLFECFVEIFNDEQQVAINMLENNIENYEEWACISSLDFFKSRVKEHREKYPIKKQSETK